MNPRQTQAALTCAVDAARAAGAVMAKNLNRAKRTTATTAHDVKLELDVRCQALIERHMQRRFPAFSVLGEEGNSGDVGAEFRWIIDPIDGTVNFASGIPHACVSIALQQRSSAPEARVDGGFLSVLGLVYDPFLEELWTATRTGPARLNGRPIQVSSRTRLGDAIVSIGFGKFTETMDASLRSFGNFARRSRKVRNMGSAALALCYVAMGRFDAYVEPGVSLWDIAGGGLIMERAGGRFWREPAGKEHLYRLIASNGRLHRAAARLAFRS